MRKIKAGSLRAIALAAFIVPSFVHAQPRESFLAPERGTLGYDLHYRAQPEELVTNQRLNDVPGAAELAEIVRVGSRAVRWFDLLQRDLPIERREELWRRVDRIGHEPTPESPRRYHPEIIRAAYAEAMAKLPPAIAEVVGGREELPLTPPTGHTLRETLTAIRPLDLPYSRASRWLMLYEWRDHLGAQRRDLRPWLEIRDQRQAYEQDTREWADLSVERRRAWIARVARACALTSISEDYCLATQAHLAEQATGGPKAYEWYLDVLQRGEAVYRSKFGVQVPHAGVEIRRQPWGALDIVFFTFQIASDMLGWLRDQVEVGWTFEGSVRTVLEDTPDYRPGAVKLLWQEGVTPHVNAVGGDTIVMDSNTARWLEVTRVTMTHEFGHVIGFPDCYVEFWDEPASSFVFYSLDPDDRMCALSGGTMERHREALLAAFGR